MAEAPRRPPAHPAQAGLLARSFAATTRAVLWLLFALVFSILVEWAGMVWWWPEAGAQHSRAMLDRELTYLSEDFQRSLVTSDPVRLAVRFAAVFHRYLFEKSGVVAGLAWLRAPPAAQDSRLRLTLRAFYLPLAEFVLAAMTVTQVFAVRLAVLTLALPVFVLSGLVALVDGLVMRDLRRWGGGRESAYLYHHAKHFLIPSLGLTWVLYLGLPFSLHPSLIILPCAGLFAAALAVTASTFKKYL
jgi:integrating conjugative element membrane protein (TIGR03747 family)